MLIKIKDPTEATAQQVTPYDVYLSRRKFMEGALATATVLGTSAFFENAILSSELYAAGQGKFPPYKKDGSYKSDEALTPKKDVTSYNNYYEFGTDKSDPVHTSLAFTTDSWKVSVEGLVEKPRSYDLAELIKPYALQERIYRLRCVEGWSMVIPWIGIPLADLIKDLKPTAKARYIEFTTLNDAKRMPGQKSGVLDWPYVEGLRLDEALHPLSFLAIGLYGDYLPNQNGAPLRLVVPWKYGFKSIKAIVKIALKETEPSTTWNRMAAQEYGFYANVNPKVDHPRWTQSKERRIGEFFKRETKVFNGYDAVASLYQGMDLKKNY